MIKRIFHRKPFVKVRKEFIQVHGDDFDIARMMAACAMSLENLGYDMRDTRKAIANMKKIGEKDA